jgi:hypothetical protein
MRMVYPTRKGNILPKDTLPSFIVSQSKDVLRDRCHPVCMGYIRSSESLVDLPTPFYEDIRLKKQRPVLRMRPCAIPNNVQFKTH